MTQLLVRKYSSKSGFLAVSLNSSKNGGFETVVQNLIINLL
ncbi:hypothetical protein S7335_103 [Synechococcus sp. PCC 7335]|nr:hypothetical protein S7335_103 [Synechococcus sp. PCC 7335]